MPRQLDAWAGPARRSSAGAAAAARPADAAARRKDRRARLPMPLDAGFAMGPSRQENNAGTSVIQGRKAYESRGGGCLSPAMAKQTPLIPASDPGFTRRSALLAAQVGSIRLV